MTESELKQKYFSKSKDISFTEVSVGNNKNRKARKIDIVTLRRSGNKKIYKYHKSKDLFNEIINKKSHFIELIEAKIKLNRTVIGQIIVAEYLFKKTYNSKSVSLAVLYHTGDELLEQFCNNYGIKLIKI